MKKALTSTLSLLLALAMLLSLCGILSACKKDPFEDEGDEVESGTFAFENDKENETIKIAGIPYKAVKD